MIKSRCHGTSTGAAFGAQIKKCVFDSRTLICAVSGMFSSLYSTVGLNAVKGLMMMMMMMIQQ